MTNNPMVMGGALTRAAALKMARFVDLCDTFHLPIVNLADQPGVMTGPDAEREGTLAAAMQTLHAIDGPPPEACRAYDALSFLG